MRSSRNARRVALAAVVSSVVLLTSCDDAPTKVTTGASYDCQVRSNHPIVPDTTTTMSASYTTWGPQAAAPGEEMTMLVTPAPFSFSAGGGGGTVQSLRNVVWRVQVPAGTELVSQSITRWANVGPGRPTASVSASGRRINVTVPGPISAGTTATLPSLFLRLRVTAPAGGWILAKMSGASYADPALSFDLTITGTPLGTLSPRLNCYPKPSPVLHRTLVSADIHAPVITIASPVDGARIPKGARVLASYSCEDHDGLGVGVATCTGTVADGNPIDTATLGTRTFTVSSTDVEGKRSTRSVTYAVVAP